jgi:hypothetical protein
MPRMNRRAVIKGVSAIGAASGLASCATRSTYIDPMYVTGIVMPTHNSLVTAHQFVPRPG